MKLTSQGLNDQNESIRNIKDLPVGKTIFHDILLADIPELEKQTRRLADEAMVLLIAGLENYCGIALCLD
jgi:hypothetical protein